MYLGVRKGRKGSGDISLWSLKEFRSESVKY